MHGERDGRPGSSPSPSMLTDETSKSDNNPTASNASSTQNPSTELAYLPIGCSVSAKYRGAFCSAQVKTIEKQVKLKVTLVDSGDTITISEEQIIQPATLRIGNTVAVRLNSSNRRQSNDSNSQLHYSRSGLAAFITSNNPDEKQATIKQIIDNSTYTVVFNDGDEKSLRRSSLCLQGIRLYQTQYGQQKIIEEVPNNSTSSSISPSNCLPLSTDATHTNANDLTSIVAIQRQRNADQPVFPALVLKRKALADYMWIRSFVDGREYIVHTRDDVQSFHNNPEIQALCRTTSKQATLACEKYIKFNQTPAVWQKRKQKQKKSDEKNASSDEENTSDDDSSSDESDDESDDDDDIDEETAEEKDSFVAQLFTFMDDRGTPINNIPKVQNYDVDLHRLYKIVRMFGGYNKVTKNNQWDKIHIKMGLPDENSSENGRSIQNAYKKYLFAYEDLTKKLGSMNAPSAYFGGRTSLGSDSRRSLIRVRQQQQEEEKLSKKLTKPKSSPATVKQRSGKSQESRPSVDSKSTSSSAKKIPGKATPTNIRKGQTKSKPVNVISSSSSESESETSDDDSSKSSSSNYDQTQKGKGKAISSTNSTKKSATPTQNVSKKPPTANSTTKIDTKKSTTSVKSNATSNNDSKQTALTIKIPISSKSKTSTPVQSIKKPSTMANSNDEKKKAYVNKIDTKTSMVPSPKKTLPPSSKTSQLIKTTPTTKQSTNESSKPSGSTNNKTPSNPTALSFKPKTSQSQTSTTNQNKDRSVSKSTASSSSSTDVRIVKPSKLTASSNKTQNDERSHSLPVKKPKPIIKVEVNSKPSSSPTTMKIPKISSNNDAPKKTLGSLEKLPKKQIIKEDTPKVSHNHEQTTSNQINKTTTEPSPKSPSRPITVEPPKKAVLCDATPIPETPISPRPVLSSVSSISDEPITSTSLPTLLSIAPNLITSHENILEMIPSDNPLIIQSVTVPPKETQDHASPPVTSVKRLHPDDMNEAANISTTNSDADEQLSPLKRPRNSISSQESFDTLSSSDQPAPTDTPVTNRNTQLTYEEITINDVLLVTWGSNGTKLYPARCIAKNDDKNELFVHYIKYNTRHDEWIKIDRIIERTDSNNGQILYPPRQRRTSHISAVRYQHTDSTSSNSSTIGNHSNELTSTQTVLLTKLPVGDTHVSSISTDDDEQVQKSIPIQAIRSTSTDKLKSTAIDESDLDENSQENHRSWSALEPISSADDDGHSSASTNRTNQTDLKVFSGEVSIRRVSTSTSTPTNSVANENLLSISAQQEFQSVNYIHHETPVLQDTKSIQEQISKRRQSRISSTTNKIESTSVASAEQSDCSSPVISPVLDFSMAVKEEEIEGSTIPQLVMTPSQLTLKTEPVLPTTNILSSPSATATGSRRASSRQSKRHPLRESHTPKDSSISSTKKKVKLENGTGHQTDVSIDSNANNDQSSTRSNSTEQQNSENSTTKRYKTSVRRGGKRTVNQQEYENDDYRSSSPSSITMRQRLTDMFKHRPSRYNFLDLNNNLTGDERIAHIKDRMRECQKVFFNLKSALVKVEKQRQIYLRKQKSLLHSAASVPTMMPINNSELLSTFTCI